MKIYLDDERQTPQGWVRAYWPDEVIALLKAGGVEDISLDHDLGDDQRGTGYDVILWIEEAVALNGFIRRVFTSTRPMPAPWKKCAPACKRSIDWPATTDAANQPITQATDPMSGNLYGYIHCFDPSPAAEAHNRAVLQSLPVTGAQITRALFSVLPNSRGHCYFGHMVHFATYPKGSYIFDDSWLAEYEALLERLFWDSSEVVHTYCGERRTWNSSKTHGLEQPTGLKISNRKVFPSYHDLEPVDDSDAPTPGNS